MCVMVVMVRMKTHELEEYVVMYQSVKYVQVS